MKYLSVCSGIEAATVAWEPLGWTPLAFSEIEPFPSAVLSHHWDVPNMGDFTKPMRWEQYTDQELRGGKRHRIKMNRRRRWLERVHPRAIGGWRVMEQPDVLIGGTPCQAFSVAGLRQSLGDDRGNLTLEFVRLANRLSPDFIVWENVPGVLSTPDNAFGCFLGGLVGAGEPLNPAGERWSDAGVVSGPERRAAWRVLDAQYFGVAQRRRRVFVVACPTDGADPAAVLLECDSVRRYSPPSREPREGAASGFECGPQGGRFTDLAPTLDTRAKDGPIRNQLGVGVVSVHQNQVGEAQMAVRRLTPTECERLQGFPDDHTRIPYRGKPAEACPDGPRYKACGNSMAVPVIRWIGERIQQNAPATCEGVQACDDVRLREQVAR